ncbi:MAG: trehalose-binding protein [Desulfovibrionales bacterium GWA2_65_9]|nr:MAG: trehalose-binding protein [Desulfovibrionales bacterium GWA2_65_9]
MSLNQSPVPDIDTRQVGPEEFERLLERVRGFHGYPAPGVVLGCFMVEAAKDALPEGVLYDALVETGWCLPDAVQMLTPCTIGNGWLRVRNFGIYAVSLFNKRTGEGVRVRLDPSRLGPYPNIQTWLLKLKPKKDQDTPALLEEIRLAGASVCTVTPIQVRPEHMEKRSKGAIALCPLCGDAYPAAHGKLCRPCRGESPFAEIPYSEADGGQAPASGFAPATGGPRLRLVPVEEAVGARLVHDMTRIEPGVAKDAAFVRGQIVEAGDVCRLQRMGRHNLYVEDEDGEALSGWVHEDEAAQAFAEALSGPGTNPVLPAREGKVNLEAAIDGLLVVDRDRLEAFNLVPDIMAATRRDGSLVKRGMRVAGTRAIPLHLRRDVFGKAMRLLDADTMGGPLVRVVALKPAKIGILVTGTEVFQGLIEDKFEPVITKKALALGASITRTLFAPDDAAQISDCVRSLLVAGSDIIITTAGMSVDPDDVTRRGLAEAGALDLLYGAPFLPGTMLLLGRIGDAKLIGVPACALFFKTTSLDLVLPRILAGLEITRNDLARMGHGGMCMECKTCTFPKCPFGH